MTGAAGRTPLAVEPGARTLAAAARRAVEAAEAAGSIPTDRAEWLAWAAQEVVDGRMPARPDVAAVRQAIIERANELLCVGLPLVDAELPEFDG
ncbi:MAG: hypothetical protein EXR69_09105 [Myxococcales bacterium]|nr:hypothetical protein [Myxococcales bacterium]